MGPAARACRATHSPRFRKRLLRLRGVWAGSEGAHALREGAMPLRRCLCVLAGLPGPSRGNGFVSG